MNRFLSTLILSLSLSSAFTAQVHAQDVKKLIKEADSHFEIDEFHEAHDIYLKALKSAPDNTYLNYKVGVCKIKNKNQRDALPFLVKSRTGGHSEPILSYYLGVSYHYSHEFSKAINEYSLFLEVLKAAKKPDKDIIAEVERQIQMCKNGIELMKDTAKVIITNLGPVINSPYPDYVPSISADEQVMVFTSRRPMTTGGQKDPEDNLYFEDIYITAKLDDSTWSSPQPIGSGINSNGHDASVALSPDGQELFIYKEVKGRRAAGGLYVSDLKGKIWTEPRDLGANINSEFWEPSASTSADENVLFFTSNRPGGLGGTDIYYSKKLPSGEFGPSKNLGNKINTIYDEDAPFIHPDGKTLYFSSKGHNSMGGYDIFFCEVDLETGEVLTEPKNIGNPINTADDDIFFVWSADGKRAYFASERPGGYGDKDIYVLEREKADVTLAVFKGRINACNTGNPIAANITVSDLSTGAVIGFYNSNVSTGRYVVILQAGKNYGIAVDAPHYLFYSKNIDIPNLEGYAEFVDEICLEPIEKGHKIRLNNVFYDVNKSTLRNESKSELERLVKIMTENAGISIEISSHTDSDGSDELNKKLSEARAHAVVDFLIENGIDKSRLTWKGYGESQPIAPNDTPENKQKNRRTEFEIVKE